MLSELPNNNQHHEYLTADFTNPKELKNKLNRFENVNYKKSIEEAIKSIPVKENDIILITGSLYLAGEVLNLN